MPIAKLVSSPIQGRAHGDAVLELAFLVSAGDGHLADEELVAFRQLVGLVRGHEATQEEIDALLGGFLMNAQTIRGEDRIREVGATIPGELRETAFKLAVGLTMVDDEASEVEDQLIGILAATLGLADRSIPLTAAARAAFDA